MEALIQQIEKLSAFVMSADPGDLTGLADAHSRMEEMARLAREDGASAAAMTVGASANIAKKTLERLILNDVTDAHGEIADLARTIAEMQQVMRNAAAGGAVHDPTRERAPFNDVATPEAIIPAAEAAVAADGFVLFDAIDAAPVPRFESPTPAMPVTAVAPSNAASQLLSPDDLPLIHEFVGEATSHLETAEAELLKLEDEPDNSDAISALFRGFHTIKGVAGFLNLEQIQSLAHATENLLDRARLGHLSLTGHATELVLESLDLVKTLVAIIETAANSGQPIAWDPNVAPVVARLNAFVQSGGVAEFVSVDIASGSQERTSQQIAIAGTLKALPDKSAGSTSHDATIKVSTDRLDSLINMVGELVIAQSMLGSDIHAMIRGNPRLARNAGQVGKITRELQDLSMSLRMIPLGGVFAKMKRLVRDVARKAGKEVDFVFTGGETELDRNMVEALSDPLVHMVRNSVDHGIETPTDREKAGKRRAGRVELRAYHQAGNVNIEILDDGKGLNKQRILNKAIANGMVSESDHLSEQDIFKLIFAAGLSTAEKVTDISGRGVGMDVVKQNIEGLRGRVDIQSAEGRGSTFTIRLPLTLAVIDGLIVKVGTQKYILPITSIEQSIRPKRDQLSSVQGRGELVMVRGDLLPMLRLHRLFGVVPVTEDPTESLIVVVNDSEKRVCLLVDELLGQEQVVIKSLSDAVQKPPGISGGAVMGDGNVSLILDVPGLTELAAR